jgi:DNA-binding SARP family transcriptional activator
VDFRILGPLEVITDSGPLVIAGSNTRAVLAELLLNADRPVPPEALIETVWGVNPPDSAPAMLRNAIAQLRRQLGDSIETTPSGYRLRLGSDTLDVRSFADLVETGREARRSGDAARAAAAFGRAIKLWRGRALADVGRNGEFDRHSSSLEDARRSAILDRIDAELELGANESGIVDELQQVIADDPYNERPRAQLMTALYRLGRQADALAAYQDARRTLATDLGLEPGEQLHELERQVLQHDTRLDAPRRQGMRRRRWRSLVLGLILAAALTAGAIVVATHGASTRVQSVPASSVAALNSRSGRLVSATRLGGMPTAVAADSSGSWAATGNRAVTRVSNGGQILQTYGVGFAPVDLAVYRQTVWLASRGDLRKVTRLQAGELTTYVLGYRNAQAGQGGRELHVAADHGGAWVGDGNNGIYRLDGVAGRLVAIAPDGLGSQRGGDLVIGGRSVWISDASHDGVVTRLDPATGGELASITLATQSQSNGPATFGDNALWTISRGETTVWRIDAEANSITKTVELKSGTVGLAFADGALWAVNEADRTLVRVDPKHGRVTRTWRFSRTPTTVAASGNRVWVGFA